MKKSMPILVAATAAAAMGLTASPAVSKEVTLRGASGFPIGAPPGRPFEALVKEINKRGKGVIQIKLLGGAPAIGSPFTLTQRMSKGAFDIVGATEGYFGNVLPEAPVLRLQEVSFATLRKNGGLALVEKLMNAKNIHYVARHGDFGQFHLWLSKPISKPDLKGLNLRVSPVYTAFFVAMGASTQRSAMPQIYTLMENGTVQGFGWPLRGWPPAWLKVTKYRVDPGFYNSSLHTLVNLRKWKSLTKAQRAVITKVGLEFERRADPSSAAAKAANAKQRAWFAKNGVKTITFKGADAKKWLDTARDAGWAQVIKRSPKYGPQLKKLFTK